MALGINQVAAVAGSFLGLLIGGVLAEMGLAGHLLGQRPDRHPRHHLEPTRRCTNTARAARAGSTGRAPSPSRSA